MTTLPHAGARLRALLDQRTVAAPGCFNALVAMAARDAGFEAAYVSGGAASVAAGVPDVGLLTIEHFCRVIREVADGSGLPVLADADTGFGEAEMVRRTVFEYHRAGAAGFHIEDQVFPKRCGHLDGKSLIPIDDAATKVAWAAEASQDCSGGAFVVCARTDAFGVDGFDAALERAVAYAEAGADMIFPEGFADEADLARFAEQLRSRMNKRVYLLANMTEFGKTPMIPLGRWADLGYDLVIYPVTMLRVAMGAVNRAMRQLREEGTVEGFLDEMQTRKGLYEQVGYTPGLEWRFPRR